MSCPALVWHMTAYPDKKHQKPCGRRVRASGFCGFHDPTTQRGQRAVVTRIALLLASNAINEKAAGCDSVDDDVTRRVAKRLRALARQLRTRAGVAAVILLALAVPADAAGRDYLLHGSLAAADVLATERALATNPRAFEANPLLRERGVRLGVNAVYAVGAPLLIERVRKDRPRLARVLTVTCVVVKIGLTVNAVRAAR